MSRDRRRGLRPFTSATARDAARRPRVAQEHVVRKMVTLTPRHVAWLRRRKNASATVRALIDRAMREDDTVDSR